MTRAEADPAAAGITTTLLLEIQDEFPRFRLVAKRDSRLQRWIGQLLKVLTLGGQSTYSSEYHTVLGDTLYLPTSWEAASDEDRAIVLAHERIHLRQRRRYGTVGMALLYLLPLLPLGLAYGRARLEWEAYTETLRATHRLKGPEAARDPALRAKIVGRFTGPAYGWMWPFPKTVGAWYDQVLDELGDGEQGFSRARGEDL